MTYYRKDESRKRCSSFRSDPPEFPRGGFFREREEFPRERFFRER